MTSYQIKQKSWLSVYLKQPKRIEETHSQRVTEAKIVGTAITSNLIWVVHVDEITEKQAICFFYSYNSNDQASPLKIF